MLLFPNLIQIEHKQSLLLKFGFNLLCHSIERKQNHYKSVCSDFQKLKSWFDKNTFTVNTVKLGAVKAYIFRPGNQEGALFLKTPQSATSVCDVVERVDQYLGVTIIIIDLLVSKLGSVRPACQLQQSRKLICMSFTTKSGTVSRSQQEGVLRFCEVSITILTWDGAPSTTLV